MAIKLPAMAKVCTPPAVNPLPFTCCATEITGPAVRLLAVVGLASAVLVRLDSEILWNEEGAVGVSTVMKMERLSAW